MNRQKAKLVLLDALGETPNYNLVYDRENPAYIQLVPTDVKYGDMFVEVYCYFLGKVQWTVYALDDNNQYKELRTGTTEF